MIYSKAVSNDRHLVGKHKKTTEDLTSATRRVAVRGRALELGHNIDIYHVRLRSDAGCEIAASYFQRWLQRRIRNMPKKFLQKRSMAAMFLARRGLCILIGRPELAMDCQSEPSLDLDASTSKPKIVWIVI